MTYCLVKRAICIWYINSESKQTARYALLLLENRGITTMDLKKDCQQVKFISQVFYLLHINISRKQHVQS